MMRSMQDLRTYSLLLRSELSAEFCTTTPRPGSRPQGAARNHRSSRQVRQVNCRHATHVDTSLACVISSSRMMQHAAQCRRVPSDGKELRCATQACCCEAMGFYFGEAILRARAQYRAAAADGQEPSAAGDWQQADFTAAEVHEHSSSSEAPFTLSAAQRDPERLRDILRAALRHRNGAVVEVRRMMVEVMCTSTIDRPPSTSAHWLPVPAFQDRYP